MKFLLQCFLLRLWNMQIFVFVGLFIQWVALSSAVVFTVPTAPVGERPTSDFTALSIEFFSIDLLFLTNPKIAKPLPQAQLTEIPNRVNYHVLQLLANLAAVPFNMRYSPPAY